MDIMDIELEADSGVLLRHLTGEQRQHVQRYASPNATSSSRASSGENQTSHDHANPSALLTTSIWKKLRVSSWSSFPSGGQEFRCLRRVRHVVVREKRGITLPRRCRLINELHIMLLSLLRSERPPREPAQGNYRALVPAGMNS